MVVGFFVEVVELAKIEFIKQVVLAGEADDIVKLPGTTQCPLDFNHFRPVLNLADLLRKDLGVFGIKPEQHILDGFDVGQNLLFGFKEVGPVISGFF